MDLEEGFVVILLLLADGDHGVELVLLPHVEVPEPDAGMP